MDGQCNSAHIQIHRSEKGNTYIEGENKLNVENLYGFQCIDAECGQLFFIIEENADEKDCSCPVCEQETVCHGLYIID
jgi:hypothetical protein